jgi:hypothetical protein
MLLWPSFPQLNTSIVGYLVSDKADEIRKEVTAAQLAHCATFILKQ